MKANLKIAFAHSGKVYHFGCAQQLSFEGKNQLSWLRKNKWNPLEYYETPQDALNILGEFLQEKDELKEGLPLGSHICEPTDRNSIIGNYLRNLGYNVTSSDLEPMNPSVERKDYFDVMGDFGAIIFNPPFREFSKSQRWIKHGWKWARFVIALLPVGTVDNAKFASINSHLIHENISKEFAFITDLEPSPLRKKCAWHCWDRDRVVIAGVARKDYRHEMKVKVKRKVKTK